jgi:hypothetical protein
VKAPAVLFAIAAVATVPGCGGAVEDDAVMEPDRTGATLIPVPAPGTSYPRWEYLRIASGDQDDLAVAGRRGWELVTATARPGTDTRARYTYWFKRPIGGAYPALAFEVLIAYVRDGAAHLITVTLR